MSSSSSSKKDYEPQKRRTWDKEYYEQRAKDREERGEDYDQKKPGIIRKKEEFQKAEHGAAGPEGSKRAFLKSRTVDLALDTKIGEKQIISGSSAVQQQGGWWCDVCECLLKDSSSYVDHINGKKHQRALGFSLRTERATINEVKDKFKSLKRKQDDVKPKSSKLSASEEYDQRQKDKEEEEDRKKKAKYDERKKQREEEKKKREEEEEEETEQASEDFMAMMGFSGFGGKKK